MSIETQNKEFDAVAELAKRYEALTRVAIVDDYYPEVRHRYEAAMQDALDAIAKNRKDQVELAIRRAT